MSESQNELESKLGWIALALLLGACLLVLLPFLSALLWAGILSYSTWPLYGRVLKWVKGRRGLAALIISLTMVGAILIPVLTVGITLADNVKDLSSAANRWLDEGPPPAPAWLAKVPLAGAKLAEAWNSFQPGSARWFGEAKRFIEPVGSWLLSKGVLLMGGLFQLALSILVTFFLLRSGPSVAARLNSAVERIAGQRGRHLLAVAGATVRGTVYGILGTAFAQAVLAGLGLALAGVPGPGLLAVLVFFLSVVPAGPFLVMLPAALWLFHHGATGWGVFMLIWGLGVSTVDNFMRPWLISQGSAMPFILILLGVLGGAIAFGFIGVFVGPTLLAVGQRILAEWATAKRLAGAEPTITPSVVSTS